MCPANAFYKIHILGIILCMHPANERLRYIGWVHIQNYPWYFLDLPPNNSAKKLRNWWYIIKRNLNENMTTLFRKWFWKCPLNFSHFMPFSLCLFTRSSAATVFILLYKKCPCTLRNYFNYLHCLNVKDWQKMKIHFMFPQQKWGLGHCSLGRL